MCMCRSTSISGREASCARSRAVAAPVVAARGQPAVDVLELVGDPRPGERRAQLLGARPQRVARSSGSAISRVRCAASVCASPGSNSSPYSPVGQQLLVGPAGARRPAPRPAASARTSVPGVGRSPSEASTTTSAPASTSASVSLAPSTNRDPLAQRRGRASPARRAAAMTTPSRASRARAGQRAQRAQERPQRRALLVGDHHELDRLAARPAASARLGAGQDHPVVAGEEALHQLAGRRDSSRCGRRGG